MTAFGDSWEEYIPSLRNATGTFSGNFDNSDTGQTALINTMLGGKRWRSNCTCRQANTSTLAPRTSPP